MSLRARLAIITVAAVALALIIANVAIERYVHSFLVDKRDDQLAGLVVPATGTLLRQGEGAPSDRNDRGPRGSLDLADAYAELRAPDGTLVAAGFIFGSRRPQPQIPNDLGLGKTGRVYFDAETRGGSPFRVVADRLPGSDFVVVAALPTTDIHDTISELFLIQLGASAAVLAAVLGLAWWLTGLGLRPLRRMGDTAAAIAAGDLSRRVEPSGDRTEIQRLGSSLNTMLSEIEGAFDAQAASEERLRQFVADASHELRTPLTAVRGYAELFRRGAADDPEELSNAMRRIEQEATRMGGLVDDMLVLARLDEQRPLETESVDLAELAADAVADLRTVDTARTVMLEAPDSLVIVGDRARLTQVLANLLANARGHTPPGTPIDVRLRTDTSSDEAVVEVADHGLGIDPELADQVFDRFVRIDTSRTRRDGAGAGLGLAIVSAIVHAHDGTCGVEVTPGGGATFWIRLPVAGPPVADAAPESEPAPEPIEATVVEEQ